jgi:trk system potassium uptake protein TrkA
MFMLIVGAGRVGSAVAKWALEQGHEVSVLDEDPEAIAQLEKGEDRGWEDMGGAFTVGTALELDALLEAGIDRADAFVASTDGDNTNLVIAQIAQRRFEVPKVVVRVLDPARAVPRRSRSRCSSRPCGRRWPSSCTRSSSERARWAGTSPVS